MSKISDVLDEYRDKFPEPEFDLRFRSGRMAEEIVDLREKLKVADETLDVYSKTPEWKEGIDRVFMWEDDEGKDVYMDRKTRYRAVSHGTGKALRALKYIREGKLVEDSDSEDQKDS